MSGERHEVESEIVLPAGMELVVPPPASDVAEPRASSVPRRAAHRTGSSKERKTFLPFVHRREQRAPAT